LPENPKGEQMNEKIASLEREVARLKIEIERHERRHDTLTQRHSDDMNLYNAELGRMAKQLKAESSINQIMRQKLESMGVRV